MTEPIKVRLTIAARIALSYFGPLLALLLFGWEGVWLVTILGLASLPLIATACLIGFVCASSVSRHPVLWAGAAILISIFSGFFVAGRAGIILGGLVALPAVLGQCRFLAKRGGGVAVHQIFARFTEARRIVTHQIGPLSRLVLLWTRSTES